MTDQTLVVIVATFGNEAWAGESLKQLKAMEQSGSIELVDAAVVVRDAAGDVHVEEVGDPGTKTWLKRGAIAGGLVGLIFPPSIIAGAVVGGAGGGIWGKISDKGFKDDELTEVGASLSPGSSAIIALAEDRAVGTVLTGLDGYDRLTRHVMSTDASAVVLAEAAPSPA